MKKHDLERLGVPESCLDLGVEFCQLAAKGGMFKVSKPHELITIVLNDPSSYTHHKLAGRFATGLVEESNLPPAKGPAPYKIWGESQIELGAIEQMRNACALPVSVKGAMMPDAHQGYGLPIGGVLATIGAVIPFCVGVDIACRMKMTVLDINPEELDTKSDLFKAAILENSSFGTGCNWNPRKDHSVMDQDWSVTKTTKQAKDVAWSQLGTSGGGNHFCEFGEVVFGQACQGIEVGKRYTAILTHSGSRGVGSKVCNEYHKIAQRNLPKKYEWAKHLAWLSMDSEAGQEYWLAMNLMGDYAAGNHDVIHRDICKHLNVTPVLQIENHHNFAWKEIHDGVEMIVHRKGATPAGQGVLGVIPGSMASPAYVVAGRGNAESLMSASHGAGRLMARNQAKKAFTWEYWKPELERRGVRLLSSGIDEVPGVYKDIRQVMASQSDLVDILAEFNPKIVRMAEDGFAED